MYYPSSNDYLNQCTGDSNKKYETRGSTSTPHLSSIAQVSQSTLISNNYIYIYFPFLSTFLVYLRLSIYSRSRSFDLSPSSNILYINLPSSLFIYIYSMFTIFIIFPIYDHPLYTHKKHISAPTVSCMSY